MLKIIRENLLYNESVDLMDRRFEEQVNLFLQENPGYTIFDISNKNTGMVALLVKNNPVVVNIEEEETQQDEGQ